MKPIKESLKSYFKKHPWVYRIITNRTGKQFNYGKDNVLINKSLSLKGTVVTVRGNNNKVILCEGSKLCRVKVDIIGDNHVFILGENSRINEYGRIRIEDKNNVLEIGRSVDIQSAFFSLADFGTKISIGDNCLFSSDIVFRTSDSHSIINKETGKRINLGKGISVGNHVWISNGVHVLKGVRIGDDSIIGTKSIVTKDIPSSVVACGCPAVVVKENVTWKQERINDE
ncbi:acyltransferase [Phocaeicola sp.]